MENFIPMLSAHSARSRRRSYGILFFALIGMFGTQIAFATSVVTFARPLPLCAALASASASFGLQLGNSAPAAERWPAWRRAAMLASQAAATCLPVAAFGTMWTGCAGFLTGSVLLLMPRRTACAVCTAVVLATVMAAMATRQGAWAAVSITVSGASFGVLVFGISRLTAIAARAQASQVESTQLAAIKERARFARDLHDLLGYSLTAIALKAELSRRVMDVKPDLAREELADVVVFARQAVADVRQVANGYRAMSLSVEAASAASVLAAADILADIEIDCRALDHATDTVLATVLREGVVNLLRHSTARTCRIAANLAGGSVTLAVINDGTPRSAAPGPGGSGLANLATRLEAIGGTLAVEVRDGRFGLLASVPRGMPTAAGLPAEASRQRRFTQADC
jgi:two-component system sensor histidine kinase DesK